eukprot:764442-Hanusia_phi.AAC.7
MTGISRTVEVILSRARRIGIINFQDYAGRTCLHHAVGSPSMPQSSPDPSTVGTERTRKDRAHSARVQRGSDLEGREDSAADGDGERSSQCSRGVHSEFFVEVPSMSSRVPV